MGISYAMIGHFLAEKVCGASPKPMGPKILDYVVSQGCGPETTIYQSVQDSVGLMEQADLKTLASEGEENTQMTQDDVHRWGQKTVTELGGCDRLVEAHGAED